jgi:hypothetical protein
MIYEFDRGVIDDREGCPGLFIRPELFLTNCPRLMSIFVHPRPAAPGNAQRGQPTKDLPSLYFPLVTKADGPGHTLRSGCSDHLLGRRRRRAPVLRNGALDRNEDRISRTDNVEEEALSCIRRL